MRREVGGIDSRKRWLGKWSALWMTVWMLLTVSVQAAGGTLTLTYGFDGVTFSIYRVAEETASGPVLTIPFDGCRVKFPSREDGASAWKDAAETLAGYAAGKTPTAAGTVKRGRLIFGGLQSGWYLVMGDAHWENGVRHTPVVFLAEVSAREGAEADVKGEEEEPGGPKTVTLTARKCWQGDGAETRPEQVELWLLRDGDLYDRVLLNEENDWQHRWQGLDPNHRWQVTEPEVPEGYTVSVSRQGWDFTVTNTAEQPEEPAPWPGGRLPQTGQLWWPAAVMAAAGILLLWADRRLRRRK